MGYDGLKQTNPIAIQILEQSRDPPRELTRFTQEPYPATDQLPVNTAAVWRRQNKQTPLADTRGQYRVKICTTDFPARTIENDAEVGLAGQTHGEPALGRRQ